MNNKNEIAPTNEIVGAILQTHANDADLERFKSSPSGFLQEQGLDLMDAEIGIVENESATVHLCLPYYAGITISTSNAIEDESLDSVLGGELLTIIGVTAGLIAVGAVGAAGLGVGLVAENAAKRGKNIDGSAK